MHIIHSFAAHGARIPLTVIGGAAGAGKTSLIRHLLAHTNGRRIAAVLTDGAGLDPSVISHREGALIVLRNGCICVLSDDDGTGALATLAESPLRPEHVLFDRSGISDLRRVSGYGYMPNYRLDGSVLVVDAATAVTYETDSPAEWQLREQATIADVVLLNKVDLVDEHQADALQRLIERLAPTTRVLWSDHARIAPPLLLGLADGPNALDTRAVLAEWSTDFTPMRSRTTPWARGSRTVRTGAAERHSAWCLVADAPLDGREFRRWAQRLPSGILNGRGAVYLREEPQHRHVFHFLGCRWRLDRGPLWGNDTPATRLLLAGIGGPKRTPWHSATTRVHAMRAPDAGGVA